MPTDHAVLDHAILGFVNERARSGYDLKKAFDLSVAHFWPANQSQIYQALAGLLKQGMVDVRVEQQDGRPNRKVYHITEKGLAELRRWLASPLALPDIRDAFLIQFYFADAIGKTDVLGLLEARAVAHRKRLEFLHHARKSYTEDPPDGVWDKVLHPLIVKLGIEVEDAWLAWAEQAKAAVNGLSPLADEASEAGRTKGGGHAQG